MEAIKNLIIQISKLKLVVEQGLKDHQFLLGDALGMILSSKNLVFSNVKEKSILSNASLNST